MAADFLTLNDLENQIGADRIIQFFDDDADGIVAGADPQVVQVLEQAESQYYSRMLRAYPSRESLIDLANADSSVKGYAIWMACELAAERRLEFTDAEGWGAFKMQYQRAIAELDLLSKGQARSIGEEAVGQGANTGGKVQPSETALGEKPFVIAPSKRNPQGSGGF